MNDIPWPLRALAALLIVVLTTGWFILLAFPGRTGELFVWPIAPHLSAFMLASAYAAGTYYWLRVLIGGRWHTIAAGLLPVGLFTTALGLATALHWGRFDHGNTGIYLWVALYATVPFAMPLIWRSSRHRDDGRFEPIDAVVPARSRLLLAGVGAAQLVTGAALFAFPASFARVWPWPLTDLTARVTAGWFAWGLVWIVLVRDPRWSASRIPLEATIVGLVVALVGIGRARSELDRQRATTWIFVALAAGALIALLGFRRTMERRARARPAEGRPLAPGRVR